MQAFNERRPLAAQLSKFQNEITKSSSRSPSPTPTAFKTYFLPVRASVGPFDHVAEETEAREQSVAWTRTRRDKHRWHGFEISAAPAVLGSASSCLHARRGDSWRSLRPTKAAGLHDANAKRLGNLLTRENSRRIREEWRSRLWRYSWGRDEDQRGNRWPWKSENRRRTWNTRKRFESVYTATNSSHFRPGSNFKTLRSVGQSWIFVGLESFTFVERRAWNSCENKSKFHIATVVVDVSYRSSCRLYDRKLL